MGLARTFDSILQIFAGDIKLFDGDINTSGTTILNSPYLFGGDKGEGGIVGTLRYFDGNAAQTYDSDIKTNMGGLVSDFRGVGTLYYSGQICSNNPYPKPWKFRVVRNLKGWQNDTPWYPEKAQIALAGTTVENGSIRAMNPAHIIYECATNSDWGRGLDPSQINEPSFINCANALCAEGFGLCIAWDRQNELQAFVQTIANHIGASVFTDRRTGLLTMMLIRGDYVADDLPLFDATSGLLKIEKAETGSSNIVNEVIVQYKNPLDSSGQAAQARAQNLASIQANHGAVLSSTASYPGIPTFELAQRVAQRDVRVGASGLQTFNLTFDRRGWKIFPGMPFRVSAPERGITNMIVRAGTIKDTRLTDGSIMIGAAQDVFGLPATSYQSAETPGWVPPARKAVPIDVKNVQEATYRTAVLSLKPADRDALLPTSGGISTLAAKPNGSTLNYSITVSTDNLDYADKAVGDFAGYTETISAIGFYDTSIPFDTIVDDVSLKVGQAGMIDNEWIRIDAIDLVGGTLTVARGCVDTLPAAHGTAAIVWFPDDFIGWDGQEYATTEVIYTKLLSKTLTDQLKPGVAEPDITTIAARQFKPYVPGNLKLGYVDHTGTSKVVPLFDMTDYIESQIVFTWNTRNRLTQLDALISHTDASVTPESGQTVTIYISDADTGILLHTETGITGTTWTYTNALDNSIGSPQFVLFKIVAARDGVESWDSYNFRVPRGPGWGFDWGFDWGL
jgi:hypothetical protein